MEEETIEEKVSGNFGGEKNYGYVGRLYPTTNRVYFTLKGGQTAMNPKYGYYFLPVDHKNYKALLNLLYMAASFRYVIHARTVEKLVGGFAQVIYFTVDW
jgi:hypothetical protein